MRIQLLMLRRVSASRRISWACANRPLQSNLRLCGMLQILHEE